MSKTRFRTGQRVVYTKVDMSANSVRFYNGTITDVDWPFITMVDDLGIEHIDARGQFKRIAQ